MTSPASAVRIVVTGTDDTGRLWQRLREHTAALRQDLERLGRAASDLDRSTDRARGGLDDLGDEARRTGDDLDETRRSSDRARDELDDLGDEARRTGDDLDEAGRAGRRAGDDIADGAGRAGDGVDELDLSAGGLLGSIRGLGPAGAIAGTAIAAAMAGAAVVVGQLKDSIRIAGERAADVAKRAAQAGLSPDEARVAGKLAAKVYGQNFGETLDASMVAIRDLIKARLVDGVSDVNVEPLAKKLITAATLLEEETGRVADSVGQVVRTMGGDAGQIIDDIARAYQLTDGRAADLLDTLTEYPTQFRDLGLSAKQALGLMIQGLAGGAQNSDKVADALKELNIRVQDGTAAKALKALGLNAREMARDFGKGGPEAARALDKILDKLRAVTDPTKRYALAQQVLGTQSEDLAKALASLDPSTATRALGDTTKATSEAAKVMGNTLPAKIETAKRWIENLKASIGDKLMPVVNFLIDAFKDAWPTVMKKAGEYIKDFKKFIDENKESIDKFATFIKEFVVPAIGGVLIVAIRTAIETTKVLITVGGVLGTVWEKVKEPFQRTASFIISSFSGILTAYAKAFGWVPGLGPKLKKAAEDVRKFAEDANRALNGIKDRNVQVRVNLSGGGVASAYARTAFAHGGVVGAAATGGPRGGRVLVGEHGPELVDLAPGSRVHSAPDSARMLDGGGGGRLHITLGIDPTASSDGLVRELMRLLVLRGTSTGTGSPFAWAAT